MLAMDTYSWPFPEPPPDVEWTVAQWEAWARNTGDGQSLARFVPYRHDRRWLRTGRYSPTGEPLFRFMLKRDLTYRDVCLPIHDRHEPTPRERWEAIKLATWAPWED
jgi:hypothetical protein